VKFVIFSILFLIGLQFFLIQPFFHSGFFPTHDDIQIIRIFEYFQSLKFGAIPPRWSSGLLFGYGYPLFVFYSPLVYFLGSMFIFLGFNFLLATKIVFILCFFVGVIGVFFVVRFFVGPVPALISSIIYSFIPYRAVDVYVRGDLAEFFAYSFFPWVLLIKIKLLTNPKQKLLVPLLGIFLGLLIISHNISVFIYAIFLIACDGFYILNTEKKIRRLLITNLFVSTILGILISCFYWLPLIFESRFVQLDKVIADPYNQYFLTLNQIWDSPWGYGGFLQQNPMSLQLGKVIIIISFLAFILNIFVKTAFRKTVHFFSAVYIVSTLLETKITQFFWEIVTPLHYLQFPWRLHILNTICGIILIGFFVFFLQHLKIYQSKIGKLAFLGIMLFMIGMSVKESYSFFSAKSFTEAKPAAATTTGEEYLPKWVKQLPNNYPADKAEFLKGNGKIENIEWGYSQKSITVVSQQETKIQIAHIYYPGWIAYINNKKSDISYDNKFGQMEINVPKGTNNIVFKFERTWWRWLADIVSVIGLLTVVYLIYINYRKKVELSK
jgi:hypothetical protein